MLGSLLLDAEAWAKVASVVQADDFTRPDHRLIFRAIAALAADGKSCDAITVGEQLAENGELDAAGGLAYLSQLARETPTAANISTYASYLRGHGTRLNGHTTTAVSAVALESWPDPVNLFAELSATPFEDKELPEELASYPNLYAQQTGIDASIALSAAVVSAAAAIPDQIQICADSSSEWSRNREFGCW